MLGLKSNYNERLFSLKKTFMVNKKTHMEKSWEAEKCS